MDLPSVIGHRGACGNAPENTLASLREAARQGVRWVEFDVKLTADGVPILLHDATLERTTDGRGPAVRRTLAALKDLDAGSWFAPRFAGERIPTLADAVAALAELNLGANVEIKPCKGHELESGRVIAGWLASNWPDVLPPLLLSSFSTESLIGARRAAPGLARALLVRRVPRDWRMRLADLGCEALHCAADGLTRDRAREVRADGVPLRCYAVDDPAEAERLFSWGVSGVFSNFPGRLLEVLST